MGRRKTRNVIEGFNEDREDEARRAYEIYAESRRERGLDPGQFAVFLAGYRVGFVAHLKSEGHGV